MFAFVVDTNILLSFFWKDSLTSKLLVNEKVSLFSPEYALFEINGHSEEIMEKTKLSKQKFKQLKEELARIVEFVPLKDYKECLKKACNIQDKGDIDFVTLSLKLGVPLWSNDVDLKEKQSIVRVFSTKEMISFVF